MAVKSISTYAHNSLSPYDGEGTKFLDARLAAEIGHIKNDIEAARGGTPWVFLVRPHANSNPAAESFIGTQGDIKQIGKHFRHAWAKSKDDYIKCRGGRIDIDVQGNPIAIDGTAGDLICCFDCEMHEYHSVQQLEKSDGTITTYDIIGLGLYPITLYGKPSDSLPASGMFADRAVIISGKSRCGYNKEWMGTAGAGNGIFLQSLMTDGSARSSQGQSCMGSIIYAQAKNSDGKNSDGWYGLYYKIWQMWFIMQAIELGTLFTCNSATEQKTPTVEEGDIATTSLYFNKGLGYGCTAMTPTAANFNTPEAISGVQVFLSDGTLKATKNLNDDILRTAAGGADVSTRVSITNQGYNFIEMLEPQRAASAALKEIQAGTENGQKLQKALTQTTDKTTFFSLAADGKSIDTVVVAARNATLGSVLTHGTAYYTVTSVAGCEGLLDGVMTCVVNKFVVLDFSAASCYSDDTSLANGHAVVKFSLPLYRGFTFNIGSFVHTWGFHKVIHRNADGLFLTFNRHNDPALLPKITSAAVANCYGADTADLLMEQGAEKLPGTYVAHDGWEKACDWDASFIAFTQGGAAINTYEAAYGWATKCWGAGVDGAPEEGKKCVNAAVLGCYADVGSPSARTAACSYAASRSYVYYCSAAALIGLA